MTFTNMSNLYQRLTVSAIVVSVILLTIILSSYPYLRPIFLITVSAIVATALWEFYQITKRKKFTPLENVGIVGSLAYLVAVFFAAQSPTFSILPQIALAITLIATLASYFTKGNEPLANSAITLFGIAYLTLPLAYVIDINYFFLPTDSQDGRVWLVYLITASKSTDTAAYFIGKNYGTKKLAPYISPSKTVEGAIGGTIAAITAAIFFPLLANSISSATVMNISLLQSLFLGASIAALAQFGDLAESLLKRDASVKDSNQLPGLGGVLDIVDSLIFTAPLLYFFLHYQKELVT